ncbi:MAG: hypothetical protein Q9218_005342, partial [Villophora microphyllina]
MDSPSIAEQAHLQTIIKSTDVNNLTIDEHIEESMAQAKADIASASARIRASTRRAQNIRRMIHDMTLETEIMISDTKAQSQAVDEMSEQLDRLRPEVEDPETDTHRTPTAEAGRQQLPDYVEGDDEFDPSCASAYPFFGEGANTQDSVIRPAPISPKLALRAQVAKSLDIRSNAPGIDVHFLPSRPGIVRNLGHKRSPPASEVYEGGLHVKYSTNNTSAANGYSLYASLIALPDLLTLLLATYHNLKIDHSAAGSTALYQYNTSTWSFEVAVVHGTLHYASISFIVKKLLQLLQGPHPSIITKTFAACLYKDNDPIADIAIIPSTTNTGSISTGLGQGNNDSAQSTPDIPTIPVQIDVVSPTGLTTTTDTIPQTALDIFNTSTDPLSRRWGPSIDREIVIKVASTALYLSRHILLRRDPQHINANPIVDAALPTFFQTAIILAVSSFVLGFVAEASTHSYYNNELLGHAPFVDSRIFRLGKLAGRFYMRSTLRDR